MIGFFSATQPAAPPRKRPTRDSVIARATSIDPDLVVGTESFDAALVLVAGDEIGHNIDRIARVTGVAREAVARMARRLVDNGVWNSGDTVSHWCDSERELASFRRDVAVAEGRLCRRTDEFGRLEWAPQGYWRKDFEYAGAKRDADSHAVRYHAHVAVPESECLYIPDEELEGDDEGVVSVAGESAAHATTPETASAEVRAPDEAGPLWLGGEDDAVSVDEVDGWKEGPSNGLGGGDVGAVWLGWDAATPQPVGD